MAEHLLSSAASAVTGELTRVLFSGLMGKLDRKAAAADKKLRRLDMLLIKINSAVEASEKHAIENASLVKWRDRLKEAAAEGDEVLESFRQREIEAAAAQAQATGDGDDAQQHQHQHQEDPSSSSSSSSIALAMAITGNNNDAPSGMGMAQGIFSTTKTLLFSSEEDMERLDNAVERLEDLSRDIRVFIKLIKLEILALAPAAAPALIFTEDGGNLKRPIPGAYSSSEEDSPSPSFKIFGFQIGAAVAEAAGGQIQMDQTASAAQAAGESGSTLLGRLEEAFAIICRVVELADGRDLSGYEWLAYWASVFRDTKWQGCAVLGAISTVAAVDSRAGDVVARCDDLEDDSELGRFVRNMESLAREAGCFSDLAYVCPIARCTS